MAMTREDRLAMMSASIDSFLMCVRIRKWMEWLKPIRKEDLLKNICDLTDDDFKRIDKEIDNYIEQLKKDTGFYDRQ